MIRREDALKAFAEDEYDLVGYWRTPEVLRTDQGRDAVGLAPKERFVALIHLGHPVQEKAAPEREPAASVVSYLD